MREFDIETIGAIVVFENTTGTEVRDCIITEDAIYFLVNEGKVGVAIGKGGQVIKNAEKKFRKHENTQLVY